jgi:hypothetical protein
MILVYPIGIPVLYARLLWHQRHQLNTTPSEQPAQSRDRNLSVRKTRFLWQTCKAAMYYWEVVERIRRLLLTGTMVFIFPNTTAQPAIACLLAACAILLVLWWSPHADHICIRGLYNSCIVFLSLYLSLLVKVQNGTDSTFHGSDTYSITLVILNILMVVAAFAQLVLVGKRAWLTKQTSFMGLRSIAIGSRKSSVIDNNVIGTSSGTMNSQNIIIAPTYSTTSPIRRESSVCLIALANATSTPDDSIERNTENTKVV